MADFNNIELRSEKVRNIIGKVPPEIIRTGIGDITVILLILILAAFFIPYPENIKATATVTGTDVTGCIHAEVLIPYRYITKVKKESKRLRDSILSPIFHSYIFAMYKNESLWI